MGLGYNACRTGWMQDSNFGILWMLDRKKAEQEGCYAGQEGAGNEECRI